MREIIDTEGNVVIAEDYKPGYAVTTDGRVYVYKEKTNTWRKYNQRLHSSGYMRVVVNKKDEYVHRIVASCFIDNPRGCKEVNHKDGNKNNNDVSNLEWCTRSENNKHAFKTGLRNYGELKDMANSSKLKEAAKKRRRLSFEQAEEIRSKKDKTDRELSIEYGISRGQVYSIRKYKTYKTA